MFGWHSLFFTLLLLISGVSWLLGLDLPRGDEDQELVASTVADVSRALDAFCQDRPHAER